MIYIIKVLISPFVCVSLTAVPSAQNQREDGGQPWTGTMAPTANFQPQLRLVVLVRPTCISYRVMDGLNWSQLHFDRAINTFTSSVSHWVGQLHRQHLFSEVMAAYSGGTTSTRWRPVQQVVHFSTSVKPTSHGCLALFCRIFYEWHSDAR